MVEDLCGGFRELGALPTVYDLLIAASSRGRGQNTAAVPTWPEKIHTSLVRKIWRSRPRFCFDRSCDLDDLVGRAGSAVSHVAMLACTYLRIS